ncbi:MAG: hypothetical protein MJ211_00710 [Bacteroidales bacterium]|nr:hypothetical protein [Bacteroidales bacterium]
MKKSLLFSMLLGLVAVFMVSCGGSSNTNSNNSSSTEKTESTQSTTSTFNIVNLSGYDFYGIMMSPSSQEKWSDVLPNDEFPNGQQAVITISGNKDQAWDIRLFQNPDDLENDYIDFDEIDLTGRTTLSIVLNEDGELWWTLE